MSGSISVVEPLPFWKRVGWLTAGQAMERGGQVVAAVLLVRLLAPENWNVIALCLSIYLASVTIGSFNLEQSLLFFLPRLDPAAQPGLIARTSRLLAAIGAAIGVVIIVVGHLGRTFDNTTTAVLLGLAVALELPTMIAGPVLILQARISTAGIWDSTHAVIQVLAVVVPATLSADVEGVLLGLVLASLVRLVAYLVMFPDVLGRWSQRLSRGLMVQQLMFCAPLGIALAAGTLARVVDKWILAWSRPFEIGMYSIAAQEIPILAVLPYAGGAAIAVSLVERLRQGEVESAYSLWFEQARAMCRSVIPLTLGLVIVAPEVVRGLFGVRYSAAIVPFQLFTIIGIHRVTEYGVVLRAAGRSRDVVSSSLVLLGCNVVAGVPGVIIGGVMGLTIATVASFAVAWWWILGRVGEVFERNRRAVFPWRDWLRTIAVYGVSAVTSMLMASMVDSTLQKLVVKSTIFAATVFLFEAGKSRSMQESHT